MGALLGIATVEMLPTKTLKFVLAAPCLLIGAGVGILVGAVLGAIGGAFFSDVSHSAPLHGAQAEGWIRNSSLASSRVQRGNSRFCRDRAI